MKKTIIGFVLGVVLLGLSSPAKAQQLKVYRIGVITAGGAWYGTIDGLRVGLRDLGLEEGKQFVLTIRDTKGNAKAAEAAAKDFEQENVDLIYTTQTSVSIAAKRATTNIPIVFCAGADPIDLGLVDSFAKPGGRLTGVYEPGTDLTAKRMENLKEIIPKLRRVVTFYVPRNPVAIESSKFARDIAQRLRVEFVERHIASVEELQAGLRALKVGEVDAFFEVSEALVQVNDQLVIDATSEKRLPGMFNNQSSVLKGGLASYSASRLEVGRLSAKYVQRLRAGIKPKDLPVEAVRKIDLVINLKTAKQIGLTIPPNVLARADKVIR
ncbi:MAG TPA: ABC transporter substrate-binding protein [Candidatus Binatia bacterium]|nr:ABC transporter substrate-binding protein [Candidatus Binatia bacterium]